MYYCKQRRSGRGGDLLIPDSERVHHEFACGSSQTLCKWMYFTNLIVGYVCTDRRKKKKWVDLFPQTLRIAKYAGLINGVSSGHVEYEEKLYCISSVYDCNGSGTFYL